MAKRRKLSTKNSKTAGRKRRRNPVKFAKKKKTLKRSQPRKLKVQKILKGFERMILNDQRHLNDLYDKVEDSRSFNAQDDLEKAESLLSKARTLLKKAKHKAGRRNNFSPRENANFESRFSDIDDLIYNADDLALEVENSISRRK